jgi:hypothetical protein
MQNNVLGLDLGLYDIYGMYHVPLWQESWFIQDAAILFCSVVCVFSLLIALFFHKKAQAIMLVDDWSSYVRQIELIRPAAPIADEQMRSFYDDLTHILKTYVYMRYGLAQYGATDHEVCTKMHNARDHNLMCVVPVLERGIAIKFGGMRVSSNQGQKDYDAVHHFIVSTKPSINSNRE